MFSLIGKVIVRAAVFQNVGVGYAAVSMDNKMGVGKTMQPKQRIQLPIVLLSSCLTLRLWRSTLCYWRHNKTHPICVLARASAHIGWVPQRRSAVNFSLRQHRTIASADLSGSFVPFLQFQKREIHTVFPHF